MDSNNSGNSNIEKINSIFKSIRNGLSKTLEFIVKTLDQEDYQGNAVINYTSHDVPYTRIIVSFIINWIIGF